MVAAGGTWTGGSLKKYSLTMAGPLAALLLHLAGERSLLLTEKLLEARGVPLVAGQAWASAGGNGYPRRLIYSSGKYIFLEEDESNHFIFPARVSI